MDYQIQKLREELEVFYNRIVMVLASNPATPPRLNHESELGAAWYALLSVRESLDRCVSAPDPSAAYPPVVVPGESGGTQKKRHA